MLSTAPHVLLVEDNPGDAALIRVALAEASRDASKVTVVQRLSGALDALRGDQKIDVVLLDLSLPDALGIDTVVKVAGAAPDVPIVVLTGLADDRVSVEAMKAGAQDYLVKGSFEPQLLARTIRYAIERKRAEENARALLVEQTARAEAEQAAARSRFLAELSRALASSLGLHEALAAISRAAVPMLGDLCVIDILAQGAGLRRMVASHADPARAAEAERILRVAPGPIEGSHPAAQTLRTGQPVTGALGRDLFALELTPELEAGVALVLPLVARGRNLGVLHLVREVGGAGYGPEELALAEDVASRAALAVDNARLYRAREDVIGIVSHDLRNPLNVVRLTAGLMRRAIASGATERLERHLDKIEIAERRMSRLIEDLLDLTRIDAGRLVVHPAPHEVRALVDEALEAFRPLAEEKAQLLEASVSAAGALPPVWIDRDRVLQVFSNLLGNAIKFTPEGGQVRVQAVVEETGVRFEITDSGPGIRPEDLLRVFDRFWQGTVDSQHGAGLGLAIAKGIVEAHGGRIWAEARPGEGATFVFTLPFATSELRRPEPRAASPGR